MGVATSEVGALSATFVNREYRGHRRSVFAGIFVGYAAYYLAAVAAVIAVLAFFLLRDTPQAYRLPPVDAYRNDDSSGSPDDEASQPTYREIFVECVLKNRLLWAIAVANAFVYFVRYGVVNFIAIGFLVYGPIMIIGLHALDLAPKRAAGTAAGLTGFFGYVFGSAVAGTGVGWIADRWGWSGVFVTMVACCLLTMGFSAMTLGHRTANVAR